MTTTTTRPRWLVPALIAGALVLSGVLALTQPWLLFIDEVASEQLPTIAVDDPAGEPMGEEPMGEEPMGDDLASDDAATSLDDQDTSSDEAIEQNADEPEADPEPEPAGPVVLADGSFISRDHETSGSVAIVQLEDGSRVLTIEGLATDNGPDLFVYLDDTAADGPEGEFDDGISLGVLRANIGDLVYEIPDDLDLDGVVSVGIWCDRFSSLFGAADLVWG